MEKLSKDIRKKLKDGKWGWNDLPLRDNGMSWSDVEIGCGLTKQELSRVKNARCPGR
jgi:hypothetical protein